MKFSILALGAAVAGISSHCAAQLHIESSFPTRAPEARLISQQDTVGSSLIDEPDTNDDDSNYFAPTPPQAEITREQVGDSQSILNDAQFPSTTDDEPAAPAGKTVKKPITTGAPLEVLDMTPEVGMVQVCWQSTGGCPTPNPIANYMMQSWCSNGLWDGYACQRARECAHIQQKMFGHNRYTCGGCAACGPGHHVGQRTGHAFKGGCSSCGPAASQCAQNSAAASGSQASLPGQSLLASTPTPQSPFVGELQAGLPIVDMSQFPIGIVPPTGYGQPAAQLTTASANQGLPHGQPLLQLPEDVPTVPQNTVTPAMPQFPSVLPALPVPSSNPVVASRSSSASLR